MPAPRPTPATTAFASPPVEYRPWPFFVLNDEYEPGAGERRLTELLENLKRVGYGGVFIHPRPGLMTEYLSPRWFEIIRHCVSECLRLGLVPALYDEHSYPSGFAGGHVSALAPETTVRFLRPTFGKTPAMPPADALALYRAEGGKPVEPLRSAADLKKLPAETAWCAFGVERMQPMPFHGDLAYTSLLDPKTTELFLQTTYERYRSELGELWPRCAAMFTDEPHLPSDCHGPWGQGLHFSRHVQSEFRRRRGYALETRVADLYYGSPTSAATRFDFYETLHEVWMESFALPLERWCRTHGIPLTGHFLEHDWPCPYATPGHVHLLAHMDWPGTDLLECFLLEGHDYGDPQNLDAAAPGTEPHALHFLRQVQSVANQLGKTRVMNESWGAGGHDSRPADWLRIGRFLAVHGVNLFVPHYAASTIRGGRKKDHPPFFSEQSAVFEHLGPLNDELGRLSWLAARGRMRQRVLVLDPLTTGFCIADKADCLGAATAHDTVTDPLSVLADTQRSLRPLRQSVAAFSQALSDHQCDFDIGDEYTLAEFARVEGSAIRFPHQSYEILVLPPGLQNLRSHTLAMLRAFSSAGGRILGLRPACAWIDGRPGDWPDQLSAEWCESAEALQAATLRAAPPRPLLDPMPPAGFAHQRREAEEGTYYLFVNSSTSVWRGAVRVPEKGKASILDPQGGSAVSFDGTLEIAASGATVLFVSRAETTAATPARRPRQGGSQGPLDFIDARPTSPNALVLDTCALTVNGGDSHPPQLVYESNRLYWLAHGMENNGWSMVIQYRDQTLSANRRMNRDSGGVARYTFHAAKDLDLTAIDLGFECPDQWRLFVNGAEVDSSAGRPWLDWRIGRVRIGHLLRAGENVVELAGSPFDVRQEIDQIYLLGEFAARAGDPGFIVEPRSAPLRLGSWKDQGLPFYDREVAYRFRRPPGAGSVSLDASAWRGSAVELRCGEQHTRSYGAALLELDESGPLDCTVTVTGLPSNLLGPFHKPGLLPKHGWCNFWHGGDIPNSPQPGSAYHLLDLGLLTPPLWLSH